MAHWPLALLSKPLQKSYKFGDSEALHTGTESRFTGSGSLMRIQCGLVWAPHGTQTTRIALLDWISHTVPQHSTQLGFRSRPCGDKVVFGSGSLICIGSGSMIRIGSGSKVLCGEPQCLCSFTRFSAVRIRGLNLWKKKVYDFCNPSLKIQGLHEWLVSKNAKFHYFLNHLNKCIYYLFLNTWEIFCNLIGF